MTASLTPVHAARAAIAAQDGDAPVASVVLVGAPAEDVELVGRRVLVPDGTGASSPSDGSLGREDLDEAARTAALEMVAAMETATLRTVLDDRYALYIEVRHPPDELLIVGAGHVAVPLAQLGTMLGFRVIVLDDREDFATTQRFPSAARVLRTDFADAFREVVPGARSFVVLVTRAHKYDYEMLRRIVELERQPRYVGMIGSRRRVKAAFKALLDAGVSRERLGAVHAPIGLDIGAETPEEIAVSIAAELVAVRHHQGRETQDDERPQLSAKERVLDRLLPERSA